MRATPGITLPKLAAEPLATEAELTPGPRNYNPYEDPRVPDAEALDPAALPDDVPRVFEALEPSPAFDAPPMGPPQTQQDGWPGGL